MDIARNPRLQGQADAQAVSFTASVHFDWRLLPYDVQGSIAHVTMLTEQGVIPALARDQIVEGLQRVRDEWMQGTLMPRQEWEDVHMNVEGRLLELIGPVAGMVHTGRSRNDQVATDMHLYMKAVGQQFQRQLRELMQTIVRRAEEHIDVIIPGYTHLQAAQPVLLAHHWLAYANMLQRDWQRLTEWLQHVDISPLGAGALSGTPYPTDPRRSAELLGFSAVYANSMDAVSDRDFLLEFLFWASAVMVHLSRLAEEMVLWSSYEFGFVTMSDAYSTGSSIMPQKRNPDVAEILRGKSGRVFGHLSGLLTVMKGLPLAYHSDMQEDKEAVFDVVDTMEKVLAVTTGMMASVKVNRNRIASRLGKDYTAATDIADKLVEQGLPFRSAHHLVGKLVADLERDQLGFDQVTAAYLKEHAPEISEAWLKELTPAALVARRQQPFATAPQSVQAALKSWQQWFSSHPTDETR